MFRFVTHNGWLLLLLCAAASSLHADVIDGEELVDPTRPLFVNRNTNDVDSSVLDMIRNVVPSSFNVSFIRVGSQSSMAVVNDQRVSVGDVIGGAEVIAIDRSSVTLSVNNQEQRISLFRDSVRAPVANQ